MGPRTWRKCCSFLPKLHRESGADRQRTLMIGQDHIHHSQAMKITPSKPVPRLLGMAVGPRLAADLPLDLLFFFFEVAANTPLPSSRHASSPVTDPRAGTRAGDAGSRASGCSAGSDDMVVGCVDAVGHRKQKEDEKCRDAVGEKYAFEGRAGGTEAAIRRDGCQAGARQVAVWSPGRVIHCTMSSEEVLGQLPGVANARFSRATLASRWKIGILRRHLFRTGT